MFFVDRVYCLYFILSFHFDIIPIVDIILKHFIDMVVVEPCLWRQFRIHNNDGLSFLLGQYSKNHNSFLCDVLAECLRRIELLQVELGFHL